MSLKARIDADLKTAQLSRDSFLVEVLRGVKSAILNEEISKGKRDEGLDDQAIEQLLQKEVKKRDESAELFKKGGNEASSEKELKEKEVIQKYLPEQLSETELTELIEKAIAETGATSLKEMGQVIGKVRAEVGSKGDGSLIAKITKEKLT